jgi:hypothetical protein
LSTQQREEISDFATASLFLACKLSNEHRRIRDVINIQKVLGMSEETFDDTHHLQSTCFLNFNKTVEPPALDENYWKKKEHMVKAEQTLLRIINFDVTVYHPHRIMILLWEELLSSLELLQTGMGGCQGDKNIALLHVSWKRVLHIGWKRLNDCLFHVDSLMCNSSWLACAALSLAMEDERMHCGKEIHWWEWIDVTLSDLNETKVKLVQASKDAIRCFTMDHGISLVSS